MPFDEEELDPHGECAAEIKRLAEDNAKLRSALEPFAKAAEIIAERPQDYPDYIVKVGGLSNVWGLHKRDFSRALDAYQQQARENPK